MLSECLIRDIILRTLHLMRNGEGYISLQETTAAKLLETALEILTILDIRTKKFYWAGQVEGVEGCFGALTAKDHTVYFSCFGNYLTGGEIEKDIHGKPITRPYLVKYNPPENLSSLK